MACIGYRLEGDCKSDISSNIKYPGSARGRK